MARFPSFISISLALATYKTASAAALPNLARQEGTIQWRSCDKENATTPLFCGSLPVPLDYTEPESGGILELDMIKIAANPGPPQGSIFFNFGGPGSAGDTEFAVYGNILLALTGGVYDLINIFPRGTGTNLPFSCYDSPAERNSAAQLRPSAGNASDVALGTIWAASETITNRCYQRNNETAHLIGTAFTARDIISVVDALGEDGLVRYWGISYGTVLGATLVSMFPDRMDKVLFDGVVNAHEYYRDELEYLSDTDKTLSIFASQCVEARDRCIIAGNRTAKELEDAIYDGLERIKYNPIPLYLSSGAILLDYSILKSIIFGGLYAPQTWPLLAKNLDVLFSGDTTTITAYFSALSGNIEDGRDDTDALLAIRGSDKLISESSLDQFRVHSQTRFERSKIGGDVAEASIIDCLRWKTRAKERYDSDFRAETRSPILMIANTADPVTPRASAYNMSAGFEGSVVLEQDSPGHSILIQASLCTAKAIRKYFLNGTVVEPGTVCKSDAPPFAMDDGWDSVLAQLGENVESS